MQNLTSVKPSWHLPADAQFTRGSACAVHIVNLLPNVYGPCIPIGERTVAWVLLHVASRSVHLIIFISYLPYSRHVWNDGPLPFGQSYFSVARDLAVDVGWRNHRTASHFLKYVFFSSKTLC